MDELVRTIASDDTVSVRVLVATELVRDATERHDTSPTASVALGRSLMGALLLASEAQDGEWVQLQLRGDGPLGTVTVTANSAGQVRGFAAHPDADRPLRGDQFDVPGLVGLGTLHVERNHASWREPYAGIVPLASGEIAKDLATYLLESEQKPSAVSLGVFVGAEGRIEAAGGYLVQSLPGASDASLAAIEARIGTLLDLSEQLRHGATARSILASLLEGQPMPPPDSVKPRFFCPCDEQRVLRAATLLGREEVRDIVTRGEVLKVRCEFCATTYALDPDALGSALPDA